MRAAVTIQSAASSGVSAATPSYARVGAIMAVATNGQYTVVECNPQWPHSVSMTRLTALNAALDEL